MGAPLQSRSVDRAGGPRRDCARAARADARRYYRYIYRAYHARYHDVTGAIPRAAPAARDHRRYRPGAAENPQRRARTGALVRTRRLVRRRPCERLRDLVRELPPDRAIGCVPRRAVARARHSRAGACRCGDNADSAGWQRFAAGARGARAGVRAGDQGGSTERGRGARVLRGQFRARAHPQARRSGGLPHRLLRADRRRLAFPDARILGAALSPAARSHRARPRRRRGVPQHRKGIPPHRRAASSSLTTTAARSRTARSTASTSRSAGCAARPMRCSSASKARRRSGSRTAP